MRVFYIVALLLALSSASYAQSAEFVLRLHFHDAHGGHGPDSLGFGYDLGATDSLDPQYGEFEYAPAVAPGGNYTAFDLHVPLDANGDSLFSGIDILRKPSEGAFSLAYTFYASAYTYPGTLSWSRANIPVQITAIRIMGGDGTMFADMLQQDSVLIKIQDYQAWFPATIMLYYNMTPPSLEVTNSSAHPSLLSNLSIYPNPIVEHGKVSITLPEPARITLTGFDETGRECLRQIESLSSGVSSIALQNIEAVHGSIMLHVEATSATRTESRNILVVKD